MPIPSPEAAIARREWLLQMLALGAAGCQRRIDRAYSRGRPVRYIRSTFVPGEARCMCLFEAKTADAVRDVNESAGLPFTRIVEALDLTPAR